MERGEWAGGRPWPRGPFGVAGNNGSINSHCSSVSFIPHIKPSIPNLSRQILKLTHFDYGMTSNVRDPNGRAYNRTHHLANRKRMMERWSIYLVNLMNGINEIPPYNPYDSKEVPYESGYTTQQISSAQSGS